LLSDIAAGVLKPPRPDHRAPRGPSAASALKRASEKLVLPIPDLNDAPDELLLTRPEMAVVMRTTTDRLERMEAKGKGPPVIRLGPRAPRYQLGTYRRWLWFENLEGLSRDTRTERTTKQEEEHTS
jgi:hypothetical protein